MFKKANETKNKKIDVKQNETASEGTLENEQISLDVTEDKTETLKEEIFADVSDEEMDILTGAESPELKEVEEISTQKNSKKNSRKEKVKKEKKEKPKKNPKENQKLFKKKDKTKNKEQILTENFNEEQNEEFTEILATEPNDDVNPETFVTDPDDDINPETLVTDPNEEPVTNTSKKKQKRKKIKSKKKRSKKVSKKFDPKKKRFGIKLKLLLTVLPTVSVAILVLLFITYNSSQKIILNLAKKTLTSESQAYTQELSVWANSIISELEMYKTAIESVDMSMDDKYNFMQKTVRRNDSYPNGIFMGSPENAYVSGTQMEENASFTVATEKWFQAGLRNREFSFGEPYYNESDDAYYATATCTMTDPQGTIWIGGADISLEYISDKVSNIKIMDAGISFLYDMRSATIIAHPDPSFLSATLLDDELDSLYSNINDELYVIGYGLRETTGDAGNYMIDIQPVEGSNFLLITFIEEETVLQDLRSLQTLVMLLMIIGIVFIGVLTERMVHIIIKPVKYLTNALSKITTGDFSDDLTIKGNDEVSLMTYSMQNFIETMRGTISDINMVSLELTNQAGESADIAETIRNSATKQANSMNDLNLTVEELVRSVSEITDNTISLAEVVMDTRTNGLQVNDIMNNTVSVSEQGKYDMEQVTLSMDNIKETVTTLVDSIERVSTSTIQINKMVGMIGDISDETNLLSINAAIEASRAGEAGKGFAVVAGQIRHLADISANAAADITKLTEYINELIAEVKAQAEISSNEILDSGMKVATASKTFDNIYEAISISSSIVGQMIEKINTADDVATSLAGITEEQAAGATEIHQTTTSLLELANHVAEDSSLVAQMAQNLTYTADDLSDQVHNFIIEKDGECVADIAKELLAQ